MDMNWDLLRIWWAVSGMLVILMQLGFVFLEMGSVQDRHRPGIAVKNFMVLLCSFLGYYLIGYHLMYGADLFGVESSGEGSQSILSGLIGWGWGYPPETPGGMKNAYEWLLFQAGFAAVAATIISGTLACRTSLFSNVVIALLVSTIVYPVFGHWVWGDGLFNPGGRIPAHDYAGSAVVHFLGGFCALVAAWIAGPRKEFPATPPDRSLPFATIGVIFLWIGWIGFNGGSVTEDLLTRYGGYELVGLAILTTCLSACAGGLFSMLIAAWYHFSLGRAKGSSTIGSALRDRLLFDPFATLSGAMGGMVAVTANCDWLIGNVQVAISVGVCGGLATFFTAWLVRDILRVDDPVEAIAVHAGGGTMGTMIAGFHHEATFTGQFLALLSCVMLVMVVLCPALLLLRRLNLLRCSPEEEAVGLTFEQGLGPTLVSGHRTRGDDSDGGGT